MPTLVRAAVCHSVDDSPDGRVDDDPPPVCHVVTRRHEPPLELQHERVEDPAQIDLVGILVVLNLCSNDAPGDQRCDRLGCDVATEYALLLTPSDDAGEEGAHPAQDAAELDGQARIRIQRLDHQGDDEAAVVRHRRVEEAGVYDAPEVGDGVAGRRDRSHLPRRFKNILCLDDFEEPARRFLPRPIFGYVSGGVETNTARDGSRAAFAEAGITLLVDTPCEPTTLPADVPRLEQVLHNLLRNAMQACEEGGKVVVSVAPGTFSVADDGRGMSPEELENAGRPFFTTKTRGTGLGLGTVKKIIEAHSGRLDMESELGKGTRVTVALPESHL